MEIITANSNPKIKNINKLNKNASFRKEEQVFIVEGIRMFRELPVDRVKQVFVSETAYQRYGTELPEKESRNRTDDWLLYQTAYSNRCHRRRHRRDFLLSLRDIIIQWKI